MRRDQDSTRRTRSVVAGLCASILFTVVVLKGCSGSEDEFFSPTGSTGVPAEPSFGAYRHPKELATVRAAIEKQGAGWIADETSVSSRFEDLQDAQVLASDDGESAAGIQGAAAVSAAAVQRASAVSPAGPPRSFSWRAKDGKDWVTPAKDQGNYGTCVSFASIGALELQARIAKNDASLAVDLSEWCLWCEGTGNRNPDPGGWDEGKAALWLKNTGTVTRQDIPYAPRAFAAFVSPQPSVKRYRIGSYGWVSGASAMKAALMKGPLVGSMVVFPYFDSFYKGGVFEQVYTYDPDLDQYRDKSGNPVKGTHHAILIVGYDDDGGYWICKNSSGPYWGDGGFCLIKYGLTGGIAEGGYQYTVDPAVDIATR